MSLVLYFALTLNTLLFFVLKLFYCLLSIAYEFDWMENIVWKRLNLVCNENISLYLYDGRNAQRE